MLSPTMSRGLLGTFLHGRYLLAANQRASPPPVRSPTFLSLWAISTDGAGGGGAKGGASGHKGLRDARGGGRGAGEQNRDRQGKTQGKEGGWARENRGDRDDGDGGGTAETNGRSARAQVKCRSRGKVLHEQYRNGGECRRRAEWEGEDTEESASEEEAATAMGAGEAIRQLLVTAGDS